MHCPVGTYRLNDDAPCTDDVVLVQGTMRVDVTMAEFENTRGSYEEVLAAVAEVSRESVRVRDAHTTFEFPARRLFTVGVDADFDIATTASYVGAVGTAVTPTAVAAAASARGLAVPVVTVSAPTCGMGFTRSRSDACVPCEDGAFKTLPDNSACLACPVATFSSSADLSRMTRCLACRSNAVPANGSTHCECAAGFQGPDGRTCTACRAGESKVAPGDGPCAACRPGTYSSAPTSGCTACTPGKFSSASSSLSCTRCLADQFQPASGAVTCARCAAGLQAPPGSAACFWPAVCAGWPTDIVAAAADAVLVPDKAWSVKAREELSVVLKTFLTHYNKEERHTPSCTELFSKVVARQLELGSGRDAVTSAACPRRQLFSGFTWPHGLWRHGLWRCTYTGRCETGD